MKASAPQQTIKAQHFTQANCAGTRYFTKPWLFAAGTTLAALAVSALLDHWLHSTAAVLLILQLGVVWVALHGDRFRAFAAAVCSALSFNFFFTAPRFSLQMFHPSDIMNLGVFLLVALITSQLAEHYRRQQQALKQATLRSNILLSVSHDLRTPLSTIIGTLSTLQAYRSKLAEPQQEELLQSAMDESHRLHHYIENLLQATKLQWDQVTLQTTEQSIAPIVHAACRRERSDRIVLHIIPDLPRVHVQASLLEQALFNVIDNAVAYSPAQEKVRVEVYLDGDQVTLDICDQGPGIPPDQHQQVFDLFYSQHPGNQADGGSGMGLTVTKSIIDAHRGTIAIVPVDHGCTIRIQLPCYEELCHKELYHKERCREDLS
ncbi:DUF4118 domain-containing protein [Photobacterium sp. TY1-4]|uniref:sensor histidine kinase n=1 Tax=Photobacterium sp. TY1-4 TaxID=2899122 RepID=UPI0021C0B01D|nr:DUF4118 domain-containing protein [Photobacterium sp. TY1-4]UXI03880.1 DUF4118 domain-containing protein [Photobacterium sp. TY1-4]